MSKLICCFQMSMGKLNGYALYRCVVLGELCPPQINKQQANSSMCQFLSVHPIRQS